MTSGWHDHVRAWLTSHDLLALGAAAAESRARAFEQRGFFGVWRRLQADGTWTGQTEAPLAAVDDRDLPSLGGWSQAHRAGARVLLTDVERSSPSAAAAEALQTGAELLLKLPYRLDEPPAKRVELIEAAVALALRGGVRALLAVPDGEYQALDTLRFVASLRLALPEGAPVHLAMDTRLVGPRLAQMTLGFGADELIAPVVSVRALRLGDNARNPELTRAEVVRLLRTAGLQPCERRADTEVPEERQ